MEGCLVVGGVMWGDVVGGGLRGGSRLLLGAGTCAVDNGGGSLGGRGGGCYDCCWVFCYG